MAQIQSGFKLIQQLLHTKKRKGQRPRTFTCHHCRPVYAHLSSSLTLFELRTRTSTGMRMEMHRLIPAILRPVQPQLQRTLGAPGDVVQLVTRKPTSTLTVQRTVVLRLQSHLFTDRHTLQRAAWRKDKLSSLLQMAPSAHFGLRPVLAQEFQVTADIAVSVCETLANPQFGAGGGLKLFIPRESFCALSAVGDPLPLDDPEELRSDAEYFSPAGCAADVLQLELNLGNRLLFTDRAHLQLGPSHAYAHTVVTRFWLQDPLHLQAIRSSLKLPSTMVAFDDRDMHGHVRGLRDSESRQLILSPMRLL